VKVQPYIVFIGMFLCEPGEGRLSVTVLEEKQVLQQSLYAVDGSKIQADLFLINCMRVLPNKGEIQQLGLYLFCQDSHQKIGGLL
jgi:hypothetical protein